MPAQINKKERIVVITERELRRLGELTKREEAVWKYLKMCRNEKTGQCNPSRMNIATTINLRLSHLSVAIPGLIRKGWISEDRNNGFTIIPIDKVPELTKSVNKKPSKVTDSVTKTEVTKSVNTAPKSVSSAPKSVNAYIVEKKIEKKTKKTSAAPTRIPEPFPITAELKEWANKNVPGLEDLFFAHLDFVEYWTNCTKKNATATNWPLRWKKGMRLQLKWQERDRGEYRAGAQVGKETKSNEQLAAEWIPEPPCEICGREICNRADWGETRRQRRLEAA